jgi:NADPH2:quinone reductase
MHAIRLHEFGPAGNLRLEEVDDPVAGEGQVRIAVEAAGVHLIDTTIRRGQAGGPFPLPDLPMTPGREVAGVVDRVGDHVDPSWLGGRVVAHLGMASGGYAELAVAPVASLHALPDGLAADVAVACIGTGRTALAVLDVAQLTADDVVLIPAAAGGLGSLFVQAALIAGAVSVGLAGGAEKAASVHEAGADHAVDYLQPDWTAQLETALEDRRATVVLDGVGGEIGHALMKRLAPAGRVVLVGWSSGTATAITTQDIVGGGLTVSAAVGPRLLNRPGGLREFETRALAEAAAERLVPAVHDRFPLRDAAAAHLALESRATRGKVVLIP